MTTDQGQEMKAIAEQIESILGSDRAIAWEDLRDPVRDRWLGSPPVCIVYPKTADEVGEVVKAANRNRWKLLACGAGSKIHWGGIPEGVQVVVSTARLNRLIERAVGDLTVTVEAGMRYADLQNNLASVGQFLALDPVYRQLATLGGIVATGDTGSWRQRYGGVRDQLLGISFVRYDGELAKAGGRVVKNVAGYDLMKLLSGSYGTLGIICQVTFRVYPKSLGSGSVVLTGDAEAIATATQTLRNSALTPTVHDLLSPQLVSGLEMGEGMGLLVRFQSLSDSVEEQSARVLEVGEKLGLNGSAYPESQEADLWRRLREIMAQSDTEGAIACKIGVRPTEAVATLAKVDQILGGSAVGQIHASSGLGSLGFDAENAVEKISQMRQLCQNNGGYLTVRSAPIHIKQQLDIWGYTGNALDIMQKIKQQFDPENIFSPQGFVGGI
ncbi:FAD-binding oxidoreductase [Phormidium sp. CCY1219]|uniref:FAD-binding oxidoreductase n=1 Tax=Phormidium sp. CCY1219 TaxID=2886104 RepID=UPI002D1F2144|nr:FAD-binding oxidoreductase [Phormidium sp. CCY1219]MEB3829562.1 FAD-binding oxidoreductase [Phormidium sp. CCY1219]